MNELLTVEEVANILRTTPNTIYRWLRAGKLTGVKIGKEWRIKKEALDSKISQATVSSQAHDFLDQIHPQRDHLIAITLNTNDLFNLEADFFKLGLSKGNRLFKGCWWQHPDDVRKELSQRGLPVEDLERANKLKIVKLDESFQHNGINGAINTWYEESKISSQLGYSSMWGSGSPQLLSCGNHENLIDFENNLDHVFKSISVVGMCQYYFESLDQNSFGIMTNLISHHNGVIFYDKGNGIYLKNQALN